MKSIGVCGLLILLATLLATMTAAYPLEDTDVASRSDGRDGGDWGESEADKSAAYDDEIVSHVVEIVNLALDALQPWTRTFVRSARIAFFIALRIKHSKW